MYYRLQQNFFHFETLVLFALSPESLGGGVRGSGWVGGRGRKVVLWACRGMVTACFIFFVVLSREKEESNLDCHCFISSSWERRKTRARIPRATVTNHNPANPPLTVGRRIKGLQRSDFLAVHHSECLEPKGFLGQSSAHTAPRQVLALFTLEEYCGSRGTPSQGTLVVLLLLNVTELSTV